MTGGWARLVRTACSDCGSVSILWTTAIDLPWRQRAGGVPERPAKDASPEAVAAHAQLLEERKRLWAAINWCGPDAEAWWCFDCHAWGVFSDEERWLAPGPASEASGASFRRRR